MYSGVWSAWVLLLLFVVIQKKQYRCRLFQPDLDGLSRLSPFFFCQKPSKNLFFSTVQGRRGRRGKLAHARQGKNRERERQGVFFSTVQGRRGRRGKLAIGSKDIFFTAGRERQGDVLFAASRGGCRTKPLQQFHFLANAVAEGTILQGAERKHRDLPVEELFQLAGQRAEIKQGRIPEIRVFS